MIQNINWKIKIYTKMFWNSLWCLIFNKDEFQHGKNTRILRLRQKLTNAISLGHNDNPICVHSKSFKIRPFLRKFSHQNEWKCFLKKISTNTCIQAFKLRIIFDADSEFKIRFPMPWLFTFSRNKVWNQPFEVPHREKNFEIVRRWTISLREACFCTLCFLKDDKLDIEKL